MPTLAEFAARVVADAEPQEKIPYGPWAGSMRSRASDLVPRSHAAGGSNFGYLPRAGTFKRRGGQAFKFDSGLGAAGVGLLPAKWSGKARWGEEFVSESISDATPTTAWLVTKETMASASVLDDGRFSTLYLRDQTNNLNYTLGNEYGTATYPALGSAQAYKVVPLWYDSGDGGITRGTSEYLRRFLVSGSRRNLTVGNWMYHPSLNGTPSRWRRRFVNGSLAASVASHQYGRPTAISVRNNWTNQAGSATNIWNTIDESVQDNADYVTELPFGTAGSGLTVDLWAVGAAGFTPPAGTVATFRFAARRTVASGSAGAELFQYTIKSGATTVKTANVSVTNSAFGAPVEVTLSAAEYALINTTASMTVDFAGVNYGNFQVYFELSWVELDFYNATTLADNAFRLFPSGPIPPLHGGTLAKGSMVSDGGAVLMVPDADMVDGAWFNSATVPDKVDLYSYIDDSGTVDYIQSTVAGGACTIRLSNPSYTPTPTDTVSIVIAVQSLGAGAGEVFVELLQSPNVLNTLKYSATVSAPSSTATVTHTLSLTAAQIAAVTDWTDMGFRFTVPGTSAATTRVHYARVSISNLTIETQGGWKGSDRFYWAPAYRFEDGSVWMPCIPRPPSTTLPNGFNLFTVDIANPDATYASVTYSNLPKRPYGCTSLLILRSPKISAVKDDNLQLDPFDLRIVTEIEDATTTGYDDPYGDDGSLGLDAAGLAIRFDHMMPPRARYIFGGDMRVCHSYGGDNPCAIEIAPVGYATDYDLNLSDDDSVAYGSGTPKGSWMQLKLDTSGVMTLTLIQGDGATATSTSTFTSSTYATIQALVDAINATTCTNAAPNDQQWRAQLCTKGANGDAAMTSLCPHNRAIASCVVDNTAKTITKAAGGLSKVAIGQLVSGAAEEAGAYVTLINSDTSLTYTGTLTSTTETLYFYNNLGDAQITDPDTSALGFQRVICGALPGFLYFTKTYLNTRTLDKQSVWMTVAGPGQAKSAANCFSLKTENRFNPPLAGAGISMGGAGVDQGFVVPYGNHIYVIKNVLSQGTGQDKDYRMVALNHTRGCCAWNTVSPGNRFVPYMTSEGLCAADLDREMQLSDDIFLHAARGDTVGGGDFGYEIPLCVAATAADNDSAYASARIAKSAIRVSYRSAGSLPNRRVDYDFSTGNPSSGLEALVDHLGLQAEDGRVIRRPGDLWGWSLPHSSALSGDMAFTAMCEARRSDGLHMYGWSDANAGSAGDGRIDEFETGETDNGTAIAGSVDTPIERLGLRTLLSAQEIDMEHSSPVGSVGYLEFHRGLADTTYQLTPSTSATDFLRERPFMLPQAARAAVDRCYLKYTQVSGSAREVRSMVLRAVALRDSLT